MLQYPDICLESDRTRANWFSCNCCQSLCRQLGNRFVHRRRPYRAYKSGDCCNGTFWTRTKSTSQVSCGASIRPQKWLWWGEMHPQYQRLYTYGFECKGPVDSIEDNLQSSQDDVDYTEDGQSGSFMTEMEHSRQIIWKLSQHNTG